MRRVLGIDYGSVRIGLALSFHTLAEPLEIIPNDQETFATIQKIILRENVGEIVCGVSEGEMAELTSVFAEKLHILTGLHVWFIDETYSSKAIRAKMNLKRGIKLSQQKPIDHYVAAELLQEWLDGRKLEERYA